MKKAPMEMQQRIHYSDVVRGRLFIHPYISKGSAVSMRVAFRDQVAAKCSVSWPRTATEVWQRPIKQVLYLPSIRIRRQIWTLPTFRHRFPVCHAGRIRRIVGMGASSQISLNTKTRKTCYTKSYEKNCLGNYITQQIRSSLRCPTRGVQRRTAFLYVCHQRGRFRVRGAARAFAEASYST